MEPITFDLKSFHELSEKLSQYTQEFFGGITTAIDSSYSLIKSAATASAAQYEALGRQMTDLASDYARGLNNLANGFGNPTERNALNTISAQLNHGIDNIRQTGIDAYRMHGETLAKASAAASKAKAAGAIGAAWDAITLSVAISEALKTGNWDKVGSAAGAIGGAIGFGELGAVFGAIIVGIAGLAGWPATLIIAGLAGLGAWGGGKAGDSIFSGWKSIADLVNQYFNSARTWQPRRDPLALDLNNNGIETTPANGTVLFDHDGDGIKTASGWLSANDAWLVLDKNHNGLIDAGAELFGVDTIKSNGQKASSGFDALKDYDTNKDNVIDAKDAIFSQLQVWQDKNSDGLTQAGELSRLTDNKITSIHLDAQATNINLGNGNSQASTATFIRSDNTSSTVAELNLANNPFYRLFPAITVSESAKQCPELQGSGMVRDLREASSLSSLLANALTTYEHETTRAGQLAQLDNLLAINDAIFNLKLSA